MSEAKEITIRENAEIKWRNELVSGKWHLTLNEMRLLFIMASHIDKNADQFIRCKAPAAEIGKAMGLSKDKQYQTIKATASRLLERTLKFEWYSSPKSKHKSWMGATWFSYIAYDDETSMVEWKFNELVEPVLLKVKEAYVKLQTKPLIAFKCVYSNRFMLLFYQWERLSEKIISILELKEHFGITDKYKTYKDFNRNVIQPSLAEINSITDYRVTAEPLKTGRTYTHFRFVIKRVKTIKGEAVSVELNQEQSELYDRLLKAGLDKKLADQYVHEKDLKSLTVNIDYAEQHREGKINFPGYLRTVVENNYGVLVANEKEQIKTGEYYKLTPAERNKLDELKEQARKMVEEEEERQRIKSTAPIADKDQARAHVQKILDSLKENKNDR